jgi:glycosyltransferase involved in cell wall biosynthesis
VKKISILVPCFNEEENVVAMAKEINTTASALKNYDWELVFIDNCSTDHTRELIRGLCAEAPRVKAIFNAKNFGQFNSPY